MCTLKNWLRYVVTAICIILIHVIPTYAQENDALWTKFNLIINPTQVIDLSEEEAAQPEFLTPQVAKNVLQDIGVNPRKVVYFDSAPYDISGDGQEFISTLAVVEMDENGKLMGTFFDEITSDVLAIQEPLHEGFEYHLRVDLGVTQGSMLTSKDSYENYPWGYDLPTNWGYHAKTCGYGCDYHTGSDYYAVDLDTYDRECVPAPSGGYVMYAGGSSSSGYGYQVIVRGKSLGGGKYYIWRIAHFDEIWVSPGWWIDKNRTLGLAGCTGYCSGSHVHFSIHRGDYAGNGMISGESLPLDRWPGTNDRVDYFDRNAYWQFSFNVCR